jgi:hypothetical protein
MSTPVRPNNFVLDMLLTQITPQNIHTEVDTGHASGLERL